MFQTTNQLSMFHHVSTVVHHVSTDVSLRPRRILRGALPELQQGLRVRQIRANLGGFDGAQQPGTPLS